MERVNVQLSLLEDHVLTRDVRYYDKQTEDPYNTIAPVLKVSPPVIV